ncbi:MAG TPA: pyridoxamine 5'-phosphate oxidase family protein [Saprospiraceae bacterium]|nr:pyridoxamine 5'-phosphate oxidase family protein [Saprospiraceae bacterium]
MSATASPPQTPLHSQKAVEKLKELAEKASVCMFCTELDQLSITSRPMYLQEVDEEGNLWFISSTESHKNQEIVEDDRVQLFFMNNGKSEYLSVYGHAHAYTDKATIEDKWSVFANAWFDGKEDPTVSIIRVAPESGYYWDTKAGKLVSMISFIGAIVSGTNTDNRDGVEGELHL